MQKLNPTAQNPYNTDAAFDWLYPERIQLLSKRHWTPMSVARKAAHFLSQGEKKRILDIGSGVGKFCLIGAMYYPAATFYGVEQRQELYNYALDAKDALKVNNAHFIHGNFTQLDIDDYDSFYFYNSFFENLDKGDRIDHEIEYSSSLYVYYCRYLSKALESRPAGTRLVTFHSLGDEVPNAYQLVDASDDFLYKSYIKR
jgi:SAM-dependent methyltransferase